MGVEVETTKPGDGKLCGALRRRSASERAQSEKNLVIINFNNFSTAGKTFPKTGQTVIVHYTGM